MRAMIEAIAAALGEVMLQPRPVSRVWSTSALCERAGSDERRHAFGGGRLVQTPIQAHSLS